MTDTPCTLIDAVRYFNDLEVCHAYMAKIRWSDGKPVCPSCEGNDILHSPRGISF